MIEQQSTNLRPIREINILGIGFNNVTRLETLDWIETAIKKRVATYICTPNADHLLLARHDSEFKTILDKADLVVSDGMGVVYASKLLGRPFKENVGGRLILPGFSAVAAQRGYKIFLLGGRTEAQAQRAAQCLREQFSGLSLPATYTPPFMAEFDDEETRRMIDTIHSAHPDILFVCLGTPKQEKWLAHNIERLNVPVSIGIGAALDIITGEVVEPPRWMREIGLEWFYKLIQEPGRLWKRYLVRGPMFILIILRQYLAQQLRRLFPN